MKRLIAKNSNPNEIIQLLKVTEGKEYPIQKDFNGDFIFDDNHAANYLKDMNLPLVFHPPVLSDSVKDKNLKVAALSNGLHIFETEGESTLTNCVKANVTEEVVQSLVVFLQMKGVSAINAHVNGEEYMLKLEKWED